MEFYSDRGGDALKPSLFELVAQEQLRDLLQPALKYVLAVFAQSYPRYLLRVVNRHEELYALAMFFVERHYLRKHNASFSENFYGLKRRRHPWVEPTRAQAAVGGIPPEERLRERDIRRSLLFLVGIPYLRAKAQDYYEQLGGGLVLEDDMSGNSSRTPRDHSVAGRLRQAYKIAYPWLNIGFEVWLLVCNIAYLFDYTPSYRPWWSWIGIDIRRLGVEDFKMASRAAQQNASQDSRRGLLALVQRLVLSPRILFDSLRLLLPTAIFFVKFLEWWYSPSSPARSLVSSPLGPPVPPPRMLPPHPMGISMDGVNYGQCPICRKRTTNETSLPSGYVFCYRCAHDHVERHERCPVTLLPAKVWQLRKVLV